MNTWCPGGPNSWKNDGSRILYPGVVALGAFDRGCLMPVGAVGRNHLNRIFGREQIPDGRHAVRAGGDDAGAARDHDRCAVAVEYRLAARIVLIDGAERVAEGVLRHLSARTAVGATRFDEKRC